MLDEATAYVDPENAEKISRAIKEVTRDKTVIMIGHKLKNLINADQIAVLCDGSILAAGTHEQLLNECEHYRMLWTAADRSENWTIHQGKEGA